MKITSEEFLKWINEQPDDRLVNMMQFHSDSECGCLMVQYARDHGIKFTDVGAETFWNGNQEVARLEDNIFNYFKKPSDVDSFSGSFGKIKEMLL